MPTISIFFGFVVQMYWRDHPPPHVHVYYQGFEAIVEIETGEIIAARVDAYNPSMDRSPPRRIARELGACTPA